MVFWVVPTKSNAVGALCKLCELGCGVHAFFLKVATYDKSDHFSLSKSSGGNPELL